MQIPIVDRRGPATSAGGGQLDREALRSGVRSTLTRLSRTGELPALPAAATAALGIAREPEAGVDDLCRVIRGDVGLSARILRVANSAAYARRIPARTLPEAVLTLGLRKTCDLLVAASARQLFHRVPRHAEQLWNHALAGALIGEEIARTTRRIDPHLVFLPALFHDVGRIAFLLADDLSFEVIHEQVFGGEGTIIDAERAWFGFDHAEAGAILAEDWGLAHEQCEGIRWHHRPGQAEAGQTLALVLNVADASAYTLGYGSGRGLPEDLGSAPLGLTAEELAACVARARDVFAEQSEIFA